MHPLVTKPRHLRTIAKLIVVLDKPKRVHATRSATIHDLQLEGIGNWQESQSTVLLDRSIAHID